MQPRLLIILLLVVWPGAAPVWAGPFKCQQPDGSIAYQEVACSAEAAGTELELDTRPPGGDQARGKGKDYTVEGQLKAMEAERKRSYKSQNQADPDRSKTSRPADGRNRAKCAKHRAETARWRREVRNGYHDRDEREHKEQMLQYHQALVEQYCGE